MHPPVRQRADGMYKLTNINHTLDNINLRSRCPQGDEWRRHEARAGGDAAAGRRAALSGSYIRENVRGKRDEGIGDECVNQSNGLDVRGYTRVTGG